MTELANKIPKTALGLKTNLRPRYFSVTICLSQCINDGTTRNLSSTKNYMIKNGTSLLQIISNCFNSIKQTITTYHINQKQIKSADVILFFSIFLHRLYMHIIYVTYYCSNYWLLQKAPKIMRNHLPQNTTRVAATL